MAHIDWPSERIFEPFDIVEEVYKHVGSHEVKTAVLIPKDVEAVVHPLLVNIHGGLFAAGHSLFAPFWPSWILDIAVQHGAVVVSPDYRLLPTTNGIADVCQDLDDFWTWLNEKLPNVLQRRFRGHAIDYSKVLLAGCSTGGYGAMQLALSHPQDITMLALAYPSIDLQSDLFTTGPHLGHPKLIGFPSDQLPSLQECLTWIVHRRRRTTTRDGFDPVFFAASLIDHGLFDRTVLFPADHRRFDHLPLERIRSGAKLPGNIWIMQGDKDSVVDVRQTESLLAVIKQNVPEVDLRYDVATGHDHFFDLNDDNWRSFRAPAMKFVVGEWLGESDFDD